MFYIYSLVSPVTGDILYIGMSCQPVGRFRHHLHKLQQGSHPAKYLQTWYDDNGVPDMAIVGRCFDQREALKAESDEQYKHDLDPQNIFRFDAALRLGDKLRLR